MRLSHTRRQIIAGAAALGVSRLSAPALAQQTSSPFARLAEGQRFEFGALVEAAAAAAKRPYSPPQVNDLPEGYVNMPYEQYVGIRALPQAMIWGGENRGISIEPLHRGYVFTTPTPIYAVEDGLIRRIAYERGKFEFGRATPPPAGVDIAFSGFRLYAGPDSGREFGIFQGPPFFARSPPARISALSGVALFCGLAKGAARKCRSCGPTGSSGQQRNRASLSSIASSSRTASPAPCA